jgi:predicted site-specific integrase-resolvase
LEALFHRNIAEVVVAHRDRLSRFGFELFKFMFEKHGAVLTIASSEDDHTPLQEFSEDVMSIITVFTARYYGTRKYNLLQKDKDLSDAGADPTIQQVRRSKPVLLQQSKRLPKIKLRKSKKSASN